MKAAVLRETNGPLTIEEIDLAGPGPGELRVRLLATGVCHTDVSALEGHMGVPLPVVLGHEGVAVVEELGPAVSGVAVGDRVILSQAVCGRCWYCARGESYLCEVKKAKITAGTLLDGTSRLRDRNGRSIGHFFCQSSFAEQAIVDQRGVTVIPHDVEPHIVAPLACGATTGMGAVLNVARVEAGSSVAVFGCGGVGLSAIMAAAYLAGAAKIIAVDVLDNKLDLARDLGATHTINAAQHDPVAEIRRLTGAGADYTFESIGNAAVISQAYDAARPGGTCVVVGVPPFGSKVTINAVGLIGCKALLGCTMGNVRPAAEMPRYVELYRTGKLPLDRLVTKTFALDEVNEAIGALRAGKVGRGVLVMS